MRNEKKRKKSEKEDEGIGENKRPGVVEKKDRGKKKKEKKDEADE